MSPTYSANAVLIISLILQFLDINVAPEALQTTVTTILVVAVPLFTMARQIINGRSDLLGRRVN